MNVSQCISLEKSPNRMNITDSGVILADKNLERTFFAIRKVGGKQSLKWIGTEEQVIKSNYPLHQPIILLLGKEKREQFSFRFNLLYAYRISFCKRKHS